jgi:hypothetical protein
MLPTELVYEIVNYLRGRARIISGDESDEDEDEDEKQDGRRWDPLRALCQTSRTLRAVCLPLLWERIDVYYNRPNGPDHSEALRSRLYRISSGLIENRTLAAYVRFVVQIFVHYAHALKNHR